jgi:predicted neuraminidase
LAAWFGGTKEGADDVAIWTSRRENAVWSAPLKTAAEVGVPHWNPVLLTKPDGKIMLFYKVGRKISEWYTKFIISKDNGLTWSNPAELVPGDRGGRGPVRNKVILLSNGTFLAPASMENIMWKAFVDISKDNGLTWKKSNDIYIKGLDYAQIDSAKSDIPVSQQSFEGRGVIQPTLWESENGKIHMLMRSSEGRIYRSDSSDYGQSWSDAYPTVLPNNNSGIDLVCLGSGILVLAFNPVGVNWGARTPIVLKTSLDNGKTWGEEFVMENDEGEYAYPCVVSDGEHIYVTYTWRRKTIAFLKLSII